MKHVLPARAAVLLLAASFASAAFAVQSTEGVGDPATPPDYVLKRTDLVCAAPGAATRGTTLEETGCLTTTRPAASRRSD